MKYLKFSSSVGLCVALALCVLLLGRAMAADDMSAVKDLVAKFSDAVVTVQLVIKVGMPYGEGSKEEVKAEVTGTVVEPSGLTVVSLSQTDPMSAFSAMTGGGESEGTSEITDVKIRQSDGKEIPAKIVLRDKDLDLAFIRPSQKLATPMAAFDLKQSAKCDVLDQVVVLSRLGKVANRSLSVTLDRVQAIVDKPRKFYIIGHVSSGAFGAPVLSSDGNLLGIMLLRTQQRSAGDISGYLGMMLGGGGESMAGIPIVIPSEDIATVAEQAPQEAPKETPKPATPTKPVPPIKPDKS